MTSPLPQKWCESLGLSHRKPPELFRGSSEISDDPHAGALRDSFTKLGLSAFFCVQGVPTVAILTQNPYDQTKITEVHAALWNQGLASLLLVVSDDVLRVFSLARRTVRDSEEDFQKHCLIHTLDTITNVLALKELIPGAESGRLWKEHSSYFPQNERVDSVLLGNLSESHRRLCNEGLSSDASQLLLMQTMFIAYLEDRKIITQEYIEDATDNEVSDFHELLKKGNQELLIQLFERLRDDFNGDLFVNPCSFETEERSPSLNDSHLSVLSSFRSGKEEIQEGASQLRFWGYDFRFIPVELISAVYDRFLGEKEKKLGAYYTPMFLADTVISQVWDTLTQTIKDKGTFLDPACGSGIFLVRSFQRLCDHWRTKHRSQTIQWDILLSILKRLHGWDINGNAVRVAVFSIYIALLEQVDPPDIRTLIENGRLLPKLWGRTFIVQDFFGVPKYKQNYDVIIGNPPWASRRKSDSEAINWCNKHDLPIPSKEAAWGFAWKALYDITDQGMVAFLLPAMGFLHNHSADTVASRGLFVRKARILRAINFADLRFQIFDDANKPAVLILFQKNIFEGSPYRFEYWIPKADLNLRFKRFITLSSVDKASLRSDEVVKDPRAFKRRFWLRNPDAKLFHYLDSLPKLGDFIKKYGDLKRRKQPTDGGWVIGQGFQPFNKKSDQSGLDSDFVTRYPFLDIRNYSRLVLPIISDKPRPVSAVRRKGFEDGFTGARILIPQGIETAQMRLRASYTEQNLCFRHVLQAITVPDDQNDKAKLITALINSKLAIWFVFHGTSSFGSDRPIIHEEEILYLPFPSSNDLPEPARAQKAATGLVNIINNLLSEKDRLLTGINSEYIILSNVDDLAYDYFCLSEDEISIIEDTVNYIIPAMQPLQGSYPNLWKPAQASDRRDYAQMLNKALNEWLSDGWTTRISLEARNADLGILRLKLIQEQESSPYQEHKDESLETVLEKLWKHVHSPQTGNFQLLPDFRIFIEGDLYLVKPMQKRFWLRSAALADADAIAADLQHALALGKISGQDT